METKEQLILYMNTHTEHEFILDFCESRECKNCECIKFKVNCTDSSQFKQ